MRYLHPSPYQRGGIHQPAGKLSGVGVLDSGLEGEQFQTPLDDDYAFLMVLIVLAFEENVDDENCEVKQASSRPSLSMVFVLITL
jgi:hypothetical protein